MLYIITFMRVTISLDVRVKKTDRCVLHLLVHPPDAHNSQGWARQNPSTQPEAPMWMTATPTCEPSSADPWGAHLGRKAELEAELWLEPSGTAFRSGCESIFPAV